MRLRARYRSFASLFLLTFAASEAAWAAVEATLAPVTEASATDSPLVGKRRYNWCPATSGPPPGIRVNLEWEAAIENPDPLPVNGLTFTNRVNDGLNGAAFLLVCPPVSVPSGVTVDCNTGTNTLTVRNINLPACGRALIRYQIVPNGTIGSDSFCDGGTVSVPASLDVATRSPFSPNHEVLDGTNTCLFDMGQACGLKILAGRSLRLYHKVVDLNGPPLLPGDEVQFSAYWDLRFMKDLLPRVTLGRYDENDVNDLLVAIPPYIDFDPATGWVSKPLEAPPINAAYIYDTIQRTIQIQPPPNTQVDTGVILNLITWKGKLRCDLPVNSPQCETAVVFGQGASKLQADDPSTYDFTHDPTCATSALPDFSTSTKKVTDQDSSNDAQRGEILTFTVDVVNSVPCPKRFMECECEATNLVVVDTFNPANIVPGSVVANDNGVVSGNTVTWQIPSLHGLGRSGQPGQKSVSFTAQVNNTVRTGDLICNSGVTIDAAEYQTTSAPGGRLNCPNRLPVATLPQVCMAALVSLTPKLLVEKTADKAVYCPSEVVTYSVKVSNVGLGDAAGVDVWDELDAKWAPYTGINAPGATLCTPMTVPSCTPARVSWPRIATLLSGASSSFSFTAAVPASLGGQSVSNTAFSNATNPVNLENSPTVVIAVGTPLLTFQKSLPASPTSYAERDFVQWTISVANSGTCPATNVQITDTIDAVVLDDDTPTAPGTLTFTPATGSYDGTLNVYTWPPFASIGASQTELLTVRGQIRAGTAGRSLTNTARLTYNQGNPLNSTPIPGTPPVIQLVNPACTAPLAPVGNTVRGRKDGTASPKADVRFEWQLVPTARDGYNVYRVPAKTDLGVTHIPAPNPPVTPVCVPTTSLFCVDIGAVSPTAGRTMFYQARSLCGTIEDP